MSCQRQQVTCTCSSYTFPHRINSGACDGSLWASSFKELDGSLCDGCSCNNTGESGCRGDRSGTCDVAESLESIELAECYQEHLHSQPVTRLPMALTDYLSSMVDDRYGYQGAY